MFGSVVIFGKAKAEISIAPFQSGSLTYTGAAQSPAWNGYASNAMEIGGTTSAVNAGTYTATFTPKEGYVWSDGTAGPKNVTWTISRAAISAVPAQSGSLAYTGSVQSPAWSNYDTAKLTIGGTTSGTNAGSYSAAFTPTANYRWSDGSTTAKTASWSIARASMSVPTQSGTLTYTGAALSPSWSNYAAAKMTIGGTTKGTNAGSYSATFTPTANYRWSDGTTTAKTVSWSIAKAGGSLSLNKSSLALSISALSGTIAVTRAGDGAISATSSNTGVATVSVSGTTVTVTGKAAGSATITVKVAAGTNHNAPANKTCSVSVTMPNKTLNSNDPATIQAAAKAGVAPNYWSVGDKVGLAVNGTFGGLSYNSTVYAFILGFNHNSAVEGNNSIHFQFGKTSDGVDIGFAAGYGNISSTGAAFWMNTSDINSGGWSGSYMCKTICPAFLKALPAAWQNVISACTKYTDNTGGGRNTASYVTASADKIWLLSEFEVYGVRTLANSAEQNYQKQYDYYKNGNSAVKYRHDVLPGSTSKPVAGGSWWLRSPHITNSGGYFRVVNAGGTSGASNAYASWCFAPGFKVA